MVDQPLVQNRGSRAWGTFFALLFIHLGACAALLPGTFSWSGFGVAVALYYLTGAIGICLGFHRLLTHRSFRVPRFFEYAIAICGALALQGGPIEWVSTHRIHHAHSDSERDPHDSSRGFYFAHMGWLYHRNPARPNIAEQHRYAADLVADPFYPMLERITPLLQVALGIALYFAGGWSWVIWGGFVRLVFTYHATWLVNSAAHLMGYRNYKPIGADKSTNNWLVALFAWGEGWHNNHHVFPSSARHGMKWWEFDATWVTIQVLGFLGLAHEVRLPPSEALARRQITTAV